MNPLQVTSESGPDPDTSLSLTAAEPGWWGNAISTGPDLLVRQARPIVGDLIGPRRLGLGTLQASAEPMVIADGLCYGLDANMSARQVSSAERVGHAVTIDFHQASRCPIEGPIPRADFARLVAGAFRPLPELVAVELSGGFAEVVVPNGIFGRTTGVAVGFIMNLGSAPDWHLSFLTADRTFGGPILEISLESVSLRILAPRVVDLAEASLGRSQRP